jgi:hypothetical protein
MPRISEFHPLDARSTCDRHEIHLASGEFLFTTSLRLAKNTSPLSRSIATAAVSECSGQFTQVEAGNCDEGKYGGTEHSRFAGKELDLICNNNFV